MISALVKYIRGRHVVVVVVVLVVVVVSICGSLDSVNVFTITKGINTNFRGLVFIEIGGARKTISCWGHL